MVAVLLDKRLEQAEAQRDDSTMPPQNQDEKKFRLLQEMRGEVLALKAVLERLEDGPATEESLGAVSRHLAAIEEIRAGIDELDRAGGSGMGGPEISALLLEIDEIHRQNLRLAAKVKERLAGALVDLRRAGQARAYMKENGASGSYFVDRRG
ncbi:hypothetical protein [Desulfofundulus salinus]|uniref:hypothetical protein n=1 Tax=Desulfofundulus salinus TaxID=2419843 RepID=UPI001A9A989E|nr:hypothetical protein [Desulfofundulus salinum]